MVDWLVSTETLQSMSHLSLRKRSLVVKEKFGLKTLDKNTLRSCYQRNGVRFRRADYKDLQKEQQELVDKLGTIIVTKA